MSIEDIEVTSLPLSAKHLDASKAGKKLIYILTQERLHLLANGFNDGMRIDILVADEAHKVGDHLRGVVLQDAIERASRSNPKIKIVFISPATQNPEALLDDAPATTRKEAVDSDIPTVLQNVVMATQPSRKATEWLFKLRQSKETYLPIGSVTLQARPTSLKKKLALIATSIGSKGGTLVYANGPAEAEEIALLLSQLIDGPQNEKDAELVALADLARRGVHPRGSVKIPRVWSLETPPPDDRRQRR
ncbi:MULTISPECIES: hypothetical protein [Bradyrhizobium]|uniref:hypothetical protein n=1 Tax=Bradyrhizobium sp. USDA 241 TaxID=3377725 RepID=UPI003C70D719